MSKGQAVYAWTKVADEKKAMKVKLAMRVQELVNDDDFMDGDVYEFCLDELTDDLVKKLQGQILKMAKGTTSTQKQIDEEFSARSEHHYRQRKIGLGAAMAGKSIPYPDEIFPFCPVDDLKLDLSEKIREYIITRGMELPDMGDKGYQFEGKIFALSSHMEEDFDFKDKDGETVAVRKPML